MCYGEVTERFLKFVSFDQHDEKYLFDLRGGLALTPPIHSILTKLGGQINESRLEIPCEFGVSSMPGGCSTTS